MKRTATLSMAEDGCYARLLDWYYGNERPLPRDPAALHSIARTRGKKDRDTVDEVLRRFFELREDGWHNDRADRELATYLLTAPERETKRILQKSRNAERQSRARQRRALMFHYLRAKGVVPQFNVSMRALGELCEQHDVMGDVTRDMTRDSSIKEQFTIHNSSAKAELAVTVPVTAGAQVQIAERAGSVCKLMRQVGINANPGDVRLQELLQLNVPDEEFRITSLQATNRGKGFGWVLAAIKGRLDDAARQCPPAGLERPMSEAERTAREWAPSLFAARARSPQ